MIRCRALSSTLQKDSWKLCFLVMEQIQLLMMPLSDIDCYLESVERFQFLSSVTFKVDELSVYDPIRRPGRQPEPALLAE
ncbi:hypothetical protein BGZ83_008326, partial [Gryganskiella cystojenkinii]